jgi:hypothetical protein
LKVESWESKKLKVEGLKVAFDGKSRPCVLAKTHEGDKRNERESWRAWERARKSHSIGKGKR